ncbi:uncharacterized protein RSE6_01642 [Rhynchosporium secalis]|uniref:Uncharacterized protein n=1 Tax=Rhynchosporium secalis TaxID=38038 RepID=A0A1E1LY96_RHYSE|nr:uncharacterized protein RSE6_01642 [Rhynchosporium secalis]
MTAYYSTGPGLISVGLGDVGPYSLVQQLGHLA